MAVLGREVVGTRHSKTKEIPVEEWGGNVLIRQLSHKEVITIQSMAADAVDAESQSIKDKAKLTRFNFELIRSSWVGEDGNAVLSGSEDDYEWLVSEPNAIIKKLTDAMAEFSGLREEAAQESEKNS